MKKIFCLIAALALLSGCDDGDMDYKTFDFSNQQNPTPCDDNNKDSETTTEIYYKINGTEGLILEFPKGTLKNTPTKDPVTGVDTPDEIVLEGAVTLNYYNYASVPSALCNAADIPAVNEIWKGEGTLLVSTVATYEKVDGADKLKGYIHTVTMGNVSFKHDGETITIVNSPFGDITDLNGFTFNFKADGADEPVVHACDQGNLIYTLKSPQTLTLDITDFSNVFQEVEGTRDYQIEDDVREILFNVYQGSVNSDNVCGQGSQVPSQPIQEWFAQEGVGIIRVVTEETGGIYSHKIYLKDIIFANSRQETFLLNDVATVTENGYLFGTYIADEED